MKTQTLKCRAVISMLGALLSLGLVNQAAGQSCCPVIPPWPGNATSITIDTPWASTGNYDAAANPSYMTALVTGGMAVVPARPDPYLTWCVDAASLIDAGAIPYDGLLYASCDPALNTVLPTGRPATMYVTPEVWHQVNYLLNHKQGAYFWNVQLAIWTLVGGPAPAEYLAGPPYPAADINVVNQLVADAQANAASWQLPCGGTVGIVAELYPQASYSPGAPSTIQIVLLEVPCTCSVFTPTSTSNTGQSGVPYSSAVVATGGTPPYTYTITSGSLPDGLTLNPNSGLITGTPTTGGTYTFAVGAADSAGDTRPTPCSSGCTITILSPTPTLTCPAGSGQVGMQYTSALTASGGTGSYTYSISSGALPTGLSLNAAGTITGSPTTAGAYTFAAQVTDSTGATALMPSCTLTINKAVLSVTADDKAKIYGAADPVFTVSYAGLVNGDTPAVLGGTLTFTRTAGENVGSYAITPGGLTSANYELTFNPGTLTISKVALSVTADAKTKTSGAVDPAFSASYSGFVSGDTAAALGGTLTFTRAPGENVGSYAITPGGLTSANYIITFNPDTLSVTKAALFVTADNKTKSYGTPDPAFSASYSGFVNGETAAVLGGTLSFSRAPGENAGSYTITPSGLTSANYAITFNPGTLTISPAPLVLNCPAGSGQVGSAYSSALVASGGTAPYTYAIVGNLPGGLTLAANGTISGTPTTAGTYPFTAQVTDATSGTPLTTTATCSLTISPANNPVDMLALACPAANNGQVGAGYSSALIASGGTGAYTYSITAGSLPGGLTLNPTSGAITGTPTTAGTYPFTAQVADSTVGTPVTATMTCTLIIAPGAPPPCVASLCGSVLRDCNADGNLAGETGLAGVTVTLQNSGGSAVTTTQTDASGAYCFHNLTAGTYTVVVTPPAGYQQSGGVNSPGTDSQGNSCWKDKDGHSHWTDQQGCHNWIEADGKRHWTAKDGRQYCEDQPGKVRLEKCNGKDVEVDDSQGKTCWNDAQGRTHWQGQDGSDCWKGSDGTVYRKDQGSNTRWKDREGNCHWTDTDGKHRWEDRSGKRYYEDSQGKTCSETENEQEDSHGRINGKDHQQVVTLAACENKTGVDFGYSGTAPSVSLTKTGPATANCGDTITYTFTAVNTGNTCLYGGLEVMDPLFGGVIFHQTPVLPGQSFVFTTNYVVKATDPNPLVTTATAVGHPPTGNPVTAQATWTVQVTPCPPPPAPPGISVVKEITCLLPDNNCGVFGKAATGYRGVEDPGFCYRITVKNSGGVALNDVSVTDDKLGEDLTASVFGGAPTTLAAGASATVYVKAAWDLDTTSTVTVSGQAATDGTQVSATDSAQAQAIPASVVCQTVVTSPDDRDGNANNNVVRLPSDGMPHFVTFKVVVSNPSAADLANVTVIVPSLASLNGYLPPASLSLPAGSTKTVNLGTIPLTCPSATLNHPVTVVALVDTSRTGGCANNYGGSPIAVQSQCSAQVGCTEISPGCTLYAANYLKSPSAMTNLPVNLGTAGGAKTLKVTTQQIGVDVLSERKYGNTWNGITGLYAQLLAAKLNILGGADPSAVSAAITQADAFLADHNYQDWWNLSRTEQQSVQTWENTLNSYNDGRIGPGHCTTPCLPRKEKIECDFNSSLPRNSSSVWFNANLSAQPWKEATIWFKNSKVTVQGRSGAQYTYPVPDGKIIFSSSCSAATSAFEDGKWVTTVPIEGDDEIFLAGLSVPTLSDFRGAGSVTWQGDFTSDTPGLAVSWKWGAAVYATDASQYNSLRVKASRGNACSTGPGFSASDHAGTPCAVKGFLAPGARGSGGANHTGSWSGVDSFKLCN